MMNTNSWQTAEFDYPTHIPTMLTREEVRYLFWLGKSVWDGTGNLVEIGPWLGGSTACLAAGMKASGLPAEKRLKVFDNFIWRQFMASRADLPIEPGQSFQSYFLENIKQYDDIVDAHARALPDEELSHDNEADAKRFHSFEQVSLFDYMFPDPVSILFIDGAKSWRGMLHLLKTLNNLLIPGQSYLVCQDYKYWGTYWVPVMISFLKDYLEPVHNVLNGTTVTFRLTKPIPDTRINPFRQSVTQLDTSSALEMIDHSSNVLHQNNDPAGAANVSLAKVSLLSHQGKAGEAAEQFKRIQKKWRPSFPIWQLERAREYLSEEKNIYVPRPFTLRWSALISKMKRRIGKG